MKLNGMRVLLALCLTLNAFAGEVVQRDMFCADTKLIVKDLREKYNEIPVVTGKVDDEAKSLMTIWMNPVEETWTIVATNKDYSCIIGVGQKLKVIDYAKKKMV
jgi:hypothetical protein